MEFAGLPLHALVVHAAVVLTPLAVLIALVFALVPRWRYLTRWPAAIGAVVALGVVWVARLSGQALATSRPELAPLVEKHAGYGTTLSWIVIGFTVVVLAGAWGLGGDSGFSTGAGARPSRSLGLDMGLRILVVVAALAVLAWAVLTGDAGARAVWES